VTVNFERWGETILGAIVAVVAIGFFAFAAAQAGQTTSSDGYNLTARFQNVAGINVGSDVRVSGVKVGVVREIALDQETFLARVTMTVNDGVPVPDDSNIRVASDGLLGGAYLAIEPGSMDPIPAGGEIINTQGAVDLMTLFSSFAPGANDDTSQNEDAQ
jgi:phospholipid/cholesterol/gamma-HCH transport system substrate-binding protein